jgi:hypothetical protein
MARASHLISRKSGFFGDDSNLYQRSLEGVIEKGTSIDNKLQPEIIFALERTLTAWIGAAGVMAYAAYDLINAERVEGYILGGFFGGCAVITMLWSFWMYYKRLSWLEKGETVSMTHNRLPIMIMTGLVVIGMTIDFVYSAVFGAQETIRVSGTD